MKSSYGIENSMLYKRNLKIHKNLWKAYAISLAISLVIIAIKGIS
jgi:hypothetical protein